MSGDVQPRKRKDKRRKKDELGVEELPRGTAAVFGEGDVLMHSYHEHGTGGHWCAKIIFFSLLSVLVTLIVLIILENRGLTELEANAVESRYSGVLDGWIEDTPDDDHHDEHTLDLKHHSYEDIHDDGDDDQHEIDTEHDEDDHNEEEFNVENDEEGNDGDGPDDDEDDDDGEDDDDSDAEDNDDNDDDDIDNDDKNHNDYEEKDDEDDSDEKNIEEDDDEDNERMEYKKYTYEEQADDDDDDGDENDDDNVDNDEDLINNDSKEQDDEDLKDFNEQDYQSNELQDDDIDTNEDQNDIENDENESNENEDDEENEAAEAEDDDDEEEVERIEREVVDDEGQAISSENFDEEVVESNREEDDDDEKEETNDDEDIIEPPIVEQIPVPSGKPFVELEDEPSSEKPTDTLAEEEEYEKRQEQIRLEKEESSSQMWLKLVVGGALLLATHAVIRRSAAPSDTPESEDSATREETPTLVDRRMTLLPRETAPLLTPKTSEPVQEIVESIDSIREAVQSIPIRKQESDDENQEDENEFVKEEIIVAQETKNVVDKELYSDEEEEVEDEEEIVEDKENSNDVNVAPEKEGDDSETEEVPDDVEIIDDEQIEEEIEDEEEDEEEISDVDDAELLSRLEAKYGRLPEPERPGQRPKDGGNSIGNEWPGEPSSSYWRNQLDIAEDEIRQREWESARARVSRPELAGSLRARYLVALALDEEAEYRRNNDLLSRAILAYMQLFKSSTQLSDNLLTELATKTLNRIYFRGTYLSAEPVYRILIKRFPNEISHRNNLTVTFLMANKPELAAEVLKDTLKLWPNDRVALAHYGFVLKTHYNKLEESVTMFRRALENDTGPACEPRFYYHLGDALLLLGRFEEADEVHRRGAAHGHFLSPAQRSLYNVDRLKGQPWWQVEETPYIKLANALERSWKEILKEGEAARALYEKEKEGLKEKGEWSQLDLFVRGQEIPGRCKRAPVTCSIVRTEPAAANCRRGQIKFSLMSAGTHVRPHVGPTNCRLRMHLGLSNTKHTYIRVDRETRQWQLGKVLLFDDSFEHEVWHNGTGARLVLIVDVWHPDLTAHERRQLPAI
ncbi:aspartyl/asparaginyl beta-hydroxylase isoform X2 [Papilio machaon]|uniref:aspartyl/asparaginyl beta-hydroxylase isoform X2 n=1 Tax=Papilio machaon TaxID=76193 RepID=UPI001E665484|nr:aspartyl/asparaginyl beta-hydroxylase isoform X2 [Papilio machaon]